MDPPRNRRCMHQPPPQPPPLSSELAVRAFDAETAFNKALAAFQAENLPLEKSLAEFLQAANRAGFSWSIRAVDTDGCLELSLFHQGGAEITCTTAPEGQLRSLLSLLGALPMPAAEASPQPAAQSLAAGTDGAVAAEPSPEPAASSPFVTLVLAAQAGNAHAEAAIAAQSLAAGTDGAVAAEPASDPTTPLTAEQQATAVAMVGAMSQAERRAFSVAFRNAFNVPRSVASLVPLITERQHLEFVDRFTTEAAGGVAA